MILRWTALYGISRYEFLMQIRRRALWATIAAATVGMMALLLRGRQSVDSPPLSMTAFIVLTVGFYFPIIFGILMADRSRRDQRLATAELLESMAMGETVRVWGQYVGVCAATLVPLTLGYFAIIAAFAQKTGDARLIPAFLLVFAAVALPGLLFVAALAMLCNYAVPVPVFASLFTAYWLWGNLAIARVPNPSCSMFAPIGRYIAVGLFGTEGSRGCGLIRGEVGWTGSVESASLLFVSGFLMLLLLQCFRTWHGAWQ